MRLPRFRLTLQRLMVAVAIGTVFETLVVRWAIDLAREGEWDYEPAQAARYGIMLHIPVAVVAALLWFAYRPEGATDSPEPK